MKALTSIPRFLNLNVPSAAGAQFQVKVSNVWREAEVRHEKEEDKPTKESGWIQWFLYVFGKKDSAFNCLRID